MKVEASPLLNSRDAAAWLGVSRRTLANLTSRHRLGFYKMGAGRRARLGFKVEDLQAYQERYRVPAAWERSGN